MSRPDHKAGFALFLGLFLVFFAVPYLFDLAYCEELYRPAISQAALVDGELAEPYDDETILTGVPHVTTVRDLRLVAPTKISSFVEDIEPDPSRLFTSVHITSRPPPVS